MEATTETGTLISASKVNGTAVYNPGGESVGKIYDVMIDKVSGKVAYPNILVKALIDPNVKYQGLIQVQSEITPACGIWKVIKLDLDLESKVPHGKWFLTVEAITASAVTPDQ
jgi:PRC-barrel domain